MKAIQKNPETGETIAEHECDSISIGHDSDYHWVIVEQ